MKSLLVLLSLVSSMAFAQTAKMEPGHYQGVDKDTGTLNADLILNADQTLFFMLTSPDFETPAPGCTGMYEEVGNDINSDVTCPMDFLPTAKVRLDITNVTYDSVRSADGAEVAVYVDALGSDPIVFMLKIVEPQVVVDPGPVSPAPVDPTPVP